MGDIVYLLAIRCDDAGFLKIVLFAKNVMTILQIVIPILLIIALLFDAIKNLTDKDGWNKKTLQKMGLKILAAASVYFAPAIVNLMLSIFGMQSFQENACWKNANQKYIDGLKQEIGIDNLEVKKDLAYIQKQLEERHKLEEEFKKKQGSTGGNTNTDVNLPYTNFPFYSQAGDSKWANYPYCIGDRTLSTSGCGAFSFSVVASGLVNGGYTPNVVAKWICANTSSGRGNGTSQDEFNGQVLANEFGLKSETIANFNTAKPGKEKLKSIMDSKLNKQSAMIVNVPNHYIAVVRSNSGKIGVIDSARTQYNKEYTFDEFWDQIITNYAGKGSWSGAWVFTRK